MRMKRGRVTAHHATRPTNITLSRALVDEAKALGVNISSAAARGLEQAVAKKRAERWLCDNGAALGAYNEFIEEHGLPLAKFRLF
jgi:antitoxin CcdA